MRRCLLPLLLSAAFVPASLLSQADYKRYYDEDNLPKVREVFQRGRYDIVLQVCEYAFRRGQPSWEWRTLEFQSLAKLGRYEDAIEKAVATTDAFPGELGALLEAHELLDRLGRKEEAASIFDKINEAAIAVPDDDRTALDYVHLGQAALVLGADPKTVIEQYFAVAKSFQAKGQIIPEGLLEAHLAAGELALAKDDYALAAEEFRGGFKLEPEDTEVLFGLARSFLPSDRETALGYLDKLLEIAPLHDEALLVQVEWAINYEKYDEATDLLDRVEELNPRHPLAAAYRVVLAELEGNDDVAFAEFRSGALSVWQENPEVDHVIGRVLSKKYRYAEGAESQKRALSFDPDYLPAKLQLAMDHLRLGEVEKAWPLADEVAAADEYNVMAFNLQILREEIDSFASVQSDDFIIRLPPNEAEIYGDRVLELLTEAKAVLGEKYGLVMEDRALIEFYPQQEDFAIRTFGSLGGQGLLGVCSGKVVTMNSPGSITAGQNNWEATLWHEYAHVVTLTATNNKMPRWLSEGISVYEEKLRHPTWGQQMNPTHRKRILEGKGITPVGQMSQAFFLAEDSADLMFAYFQSMLIVEFLVEEFGEESLRGILADLATGSLINEAISAHTTAMADLERRFADHAKTLAESYGSQVDWTEPGPEEVNPLSTLAVGAYLKKNPKNFWAHQTLTMRHLEAKNWKEAATAAEAYTALLPEYTGSANGYVLHARALRELGDLEGETAVLENLASRSADAYQAYQRLIETGFGSEDWDAVLTNADRAAAVDPFSDRLHFCRGCALAARNENSLAADSFAKALLLRPANPSEVRYRLAGVLREENPVEAKRHILDALADSPRYRDAHALLLDIVEPEEEKPDETAPDPSGGSGAPSRTPEQIAAPL